MAGNNTWCIRGRTQHGQEQSRYCEPCVCTTLPSNYLIRTILHLNALYSTRCKRRY